MDLARILAYVTGTVDQELLARNEYLAAENRILKAQLKGRLKLSDAERATLGEIWSSRGAAEVVAVARPDTILAWYRKLVACKFDGSQVRHGPGRPRIKREVEQLIVHMAGENRDWGYDRIAGALANKRSASRALLPCSPWRGRVITHNNPSYRTDNPSSPVLKAIRRVLPDACISDTKIKIQTRH